MHRSFLSKYNIYITLGIFSLFFLFPYFSFAATYYFNNAVNESPTELGNYWNNVEQNDPALELPNFSVDEVTVFESVFAGNIIFNGNAKNKMGIIQGNAVFNGNSYNYAGDITGNATFNTTFYSTTIPSGGVFIFEDNDWTGTISGIVYGSDNVPISNYIFKGDIIEKSGAIPNTATKTRYYTDDVVTTRDFISSGPWTVVADGAEVDLTSALYNDTTTFSTLNGGSFIYGPISLSYQYLNSELSI